MVIATSSYDSPVQPATHEHAHAQANAHAHAHAHLASVLARALLREPAAVRSLIDAVSPVIQARVARAVLRQRSTRSQGRSPREEVKDLTQEVFLALFDDDSKALRAWRPDGGLSLPNFVGLIAEHQVASVFRSGRRRPWSDALLFDEDLDASPGGVGGGAGAGGTDHRIASRELYTQLLARLRAELTPRGLELFHALIVQEKTVDDVCAATSMSTDAVYAWRSRLMKLVRRLGAELDSDRRLAQAKETAS